MAKNETNINLDYLKEMNSILNEIKESLSSINSDGINSLKEAISKGPDITIWDRINNISSISSVIETGMTLIFALLNNSSKQVNKQMESIKSTIVDALTDSRIMNASKELGKNVAEGMINGIKGKTVNIKKTSMDMATGLIDSTQTILQISSPSKVMKRIGEYVAQGLGDGIKSGAKEASKAMENLSDDVIDSSDSLKKVSKNAKSCVDSLDEVGDAADKIGGKDISFGGGLVAVAAVVATLVGYFTDLMMSNEEFASKVDKVWSKIKEAFQPVVDIVMNLFDSFVSGSGSAGGAMDGLVNIISGIAEFIAEALGGLGEFFSEHGEEILEVIMGVWETVSELFTTIFEFISEIFSENGEEIMEWILSIWEFISGIFEGAVEVIQGVLDIICGIFTGNGELIKEGLGLLWEGICGIFSAGLEFVGSIFSMAWEVICGIFSVVAEFFGNVFSAGWEAIKNAFSFVGEFFSNVWDGIKNVFAKVGSWFGSIFKSAWNGVKNAFSGCVKFFSNIWSSIKSMFSKIGTAIGNGISGAFKSVVNAVISFASGIINGFIGAINGAIRLINKIPGVEIPVIARVSLPRLAKGGIVDAGQMFIAREAGPELVGSFNGKTAVMNNDQIVASVSKGVYSAVSAALGSNMVGGDWTIQIVDNNGRVKSQDIITAIERRNRRDGKTIIALGV